MARRFALVVGVVGFLSLLLVGSSFAGSGACQGGPGTIQAPWGHVPPSSFEGFDKLHGILVYKIVELRATFDLRPVGGNGEVVCLDNLCPHYPDFNVAFYREGQLTHPRVGVFDDLGPVNGNVPSDAHYALVWMRAGAEARFVWETCS